MQMNVLRTKQQQQQQQVLQEHKPVDWVDGDVDRAGHGRVAAGENHATIVQRTTETNDGYRRRR